MDLTVNKLNNNSSKWIKSSQSNVTLSKLSCCNKIKIFSRKVIKTKLENHNSITYYEACLPYVENYFDFLNLIRSLQEIEFLKKIFLLENQIKLFNLIKFKIPKGNASHNLNKEEEVVVDHSILFSNKNENSEVDKRILKLIDFCG